MDLTALKAAKRAEEDSFDPEVVIGVHEQETAETAAATEEATAPTNDKEVPEETPKPPVDEGEKTPEDEHDEEIAEEAGDEKTAEAEPAETKLNETFRPEREQPGEDLHLDSTIAHRQTTERAGMGYPGEIPMPQPMPPQYGGGGGYSPGGGASAVGGALASLIAAPLGLAGGVIRGFAGHMTGWMAQRGVNAQAPAIPPVAQAEMAIVDASLASKSVIESAETLRKHPGYAAWQRDLEAAARPIGKTVGDVIREMNETGTHSKLYTQFQQLRSDQEFAAMHTDLMTRMKAHQSKWEEAAVRVEAAGGRSEDLWHHLDTATASIRTATQAIPSEQPGMSMADHAKNILSGLRDFFCKVFRIVPKVEAEAPRPSSPRA